MRRARPDEAEALSELVRRSKAHWGYPPALLEHWREELAVPPSGEVWVAERDGTAAGVLVLRAGEVDMLFVDPPHIGRGVGSALWRHALDRAAALGWPTLDVEADPNAEPFYLAMGAVRIGARPSSVPGRDLPLLRATVTVTPPS